LRSAISHTCSQLNCWLVHFSTDYVFDGESAEAYKENDQTNPQSVYGDTKLKGEVAIQTSGCRYIIIRTAWVFSEYGDNFLKTMLRLAVSGDALKVVGDQIGCPSYAQDIAKAVVCILDSLKSEEFCSGLYNFAGNFTCSWAEFSQYIFEEAVRIDLLSAKPKVSTITTEQYPTPVKRPAQSQLNSNKIGAIFGIDPSDCMLGIRSSLAAIKNQMKK
jgi:dTDP-4-dehydrorhamnose reductase